MAAMRTVRKCRPSLASGVDILAETGVDILAESGATPTDFDTPAGRAVRRASILLFSLVEQGVSSAERP